MGGRLLRRWLGQPLLDVAALERRLDAVEAWQGDAMLPGRAARAAARAGRPGALDEPLRPGHRAAAGPASGIREALGRVEKVGGSCSTPVACQPGRWTPAPTSRGCSGRRSPTIRPRRWPTPASSGPASRPSWTASTWRRRDAKSWIANLESVERARTGIKSLKVGYNRVFGYYIEVTQANAALVPADYIRKQTLVNAERYITPELKEYESLVLNAEERVLELEGQLYRQVLAQVAAGAGQLLQTAGRLAELDVFSGLAEVAEANKYVRPNLAEDGAVSKCGFFFSFFCTVA